ncbi:unnamed protein product [Orchesella dallaii]|uniref:F-box domain-containing protein n=1 Tax=Orchesella dallaii TaxID=48710 RepID=A0ABP1S6D4_9HEXA
MRYISNGDVLRLRLTCKQINTEIIQRFGISSKINVRHDVSSPELSEFFSKTVCRWVHISKKCVFGDSIRLHDIFLHPEQLETLEIWGRVSYTFLLDVLLHCSNLIYLCLEGTISGDDVATVPRITMNTNRISLQRLRQLTCTATPAELILSSIIKGVSAPQLFQLYLRFDISNRLITEGLYHVMMKLAEFIENSPTIKLFSVQFYDTRLYVVMNLLHMHRLPKICIQNESELQQISSKLSKLGEKIQLFAVRIVGSPLLNLSFWKEFLRQQNELRSISISFGQLSWAGIVEVLAGNSSSLVRVSLGAEFITSEPMSLLVFATCKNLEELALSQRKLEGQTFIADLAVLKELPKFKQLDAYGTTLHMTMEDYKSVLEFPKHWILYVMCNVNGEFKSKKILKVRILIKNSFVSTDRKNHTTT